MTDQIEFDVDADGVGLISVRRPEKLNAVTKSMSAELFSVVDRVAADPAVRALVITGEDERAFCLGSDISEVTPIPIRGPSTASSSSGLVAMAVRCFCASCWAPVIQWLPKVDPRRRYRLAGSGR